MNRGDFCQYYTNENLDGKCLNCDFSICCVSSTLLLLSLTPSSHLWTIIVLCLDGSTGIEQKQPPVRTAQKINSLLTLNGAQMCWN